MYIDWAAADARPHSLNRPFGSHVSPWVSSSQSRTPLVFTPLSHKKQVAQHPSSCRHILRDQPLTGITYVLLKKGADPIISSSFYLFSFISSFSCYSPSPSSRPSPACHSLPIWVTHTRWRRLIPHSAERKVEPPKAPHAGSCASFSTCS